MRKAGQKRSQSGASDEPAGSSEVEDKTAPADAADESSADRASGPVGVTNDLDSLGEQLARSIEGGPTTGNPAPQQDLPPPATNATPEEILGLQAQSIEAKDEPAAPPPVDNPAAVAKAGAPGGTSQKQGYEEHAAMANEVLRAHSDQPRSTDRPQPVEAENPESPSDEETKEKEVVEGPDGDVRYSEDMTISAKRRPRRKLFGR
jgi:hypothetical protein